MLPNPSTVDRRSQRVTTVKETIIIVNDDDFCPSLFFNIGSGMIKLPLTINVL